MNVDHADWRSFDKGDLKNLPPLRRFARDNGFKYYYTGRPCSKGHATARYTGSANCVICHSIKEKERNKKTETTFASKSKPMDSVKFMGIVISKKLSSGKSSYYR